MFNIFKVSCNMAGDVIPFKGAPVFESTGCFTYTKFTYSFKFVPNKILNVNCFSMNRMIEILLFWGFVLFFVYWQFM